MKKKRKPANKRGSHMTVTNAIRVAMQLLSDNACPGNTMHGTLNMERCRAIATLINDARGYDK